MSRRVSEQQQSLYRPETPHYELPAHAPDASFSTPLPPTVSRHADPSQGLAYPVELPHHDQYLHPPELSVGRSPSTSSTRFDASSSAAPTRNGTLRKRLSTNKRGDLSRKSSKKSVSGSNSRIPEPKLDEQYYNIFRVPIPTSGNPTEVLANRFQAWRRLLKDLITYFREIQTNYEQRTKALSKLSTSINNLSPGREFMSDGGLNDAIGILRTFTHISVAEANKARSIEEDVITQLNGLRNDLNQKIKEIKSLSGDFKNSVDKERDGTKRIVDQLRDALVLAGSNPTAASGKSDPFIVRLAVERQVEKQIDEENYLHRAYLNLEGSGRELEAIVVGEIQKAYNAYAGILRREGDNAHNAAEQLRSGPIAIPKDWEWDNFVQGNSNFINPSLPLRKIENITYPGRFNPAAAEIRAGTLERKSKYLKSYTPGWYVLSATHIHEFKSADHVQTQSPVMSLFLLDQKPGSHSESGSGSSKFSLKGRQTGAMHRGHSWVFRAESHDTMMAWYEDIRNLIEKTGDDKAAFIQKHARNLSGPSTVAASALSSEPPLGEDDQQMPAAVTQTQELSNNAQELSNTAHAMYGASESQYINAAPFNRSSQQAPQTLRSTGSSIYGGTNSLAPDPRSSAAPQMGNASAHEHERRASGDDLFHGMTPQAAQLVPRTSGSMPHALHHQDVISTDARSSYSTNAMMSSARHDDSVDPLEQPAGMAMRQYLNESRSSSGPFPSLQQPRSFTQASNTVRSSSNPAHQQMPRSSGDYSPTSTSRNVAAFHARSSGAGTERTTSLGVDTVSANVPRTYGNHEHSRDSAEYSPTSMPKMALNFAGGLPMADEPTPQPPQVDLFAHDAVHEENYVYDALPHADSDHYTPGRPHDNSQFGMTATDNLPNTGLPPNSSIPMNSSINFSNHAQLRIPSMQQWRRSSSVYDGDDLHSRPPTTNSADLAETPPTDGYATTTTTEDPDRDRDELTVTTTTEPRTSVDTTIQMPESHESSNEKDDDMMNPESRVGLVRGGKWDGTVPVVSEVYVPGHKFALGKSAFSEHF